jgi:predicted nucleotidyltransferase
VRGWSDIDLLVVFRDIARVNILERLYVTGEFMREREGGYIYM